MDDTATSREQQLQVPQVEAPPLEAAGSQVVVASAGACAASAGPAASAASAGSAALSDDARASLERREVLRHVEGAVEVQIERSLLSAETAWQPADYLPDPAGEGFIDELTAMRECAASLPDELLVVLVGDMITEEALPTYMSLLNTLEGCNDVTGTGESAWARWSRAWTAEENRHGDLLNRYLYLTGRVDMRAVERTIQRLISRGFDPNFNPGGVKPSGDPYRGFIYTSFQERATKLSHSNVGKLASRHGDAKLARVCAAIAGDEARHERAYTAFVSSMFDADPSGAMVAYAEMMRSQIAMPAELMDDCSNPNLFADYSNVASRLGVYTASDYTDILEHLNRAWEVETRGGLNAEGQAAQEYVSKLPERFRRLAARGRRGQTEDVPHVKTSWSWLGGREA